MPSKSCGIRGTLRLKQMDIKWHGENRFKDIDSDTYWNFAWDVSRDEALDKIIDHVLRWKKELPDENYFGRTHFMPRTRKLTESEMAQLGLKHKFHKP